jgi:hypothetical protein
MRQVSAELADGVGEQNLGGMSPFAPFSNLSTEP